MQRPAVDLDAVGVLFALTADAVLILEGEQVVAWNEPAVALFGVPAAEACAPGARPLGPDLAPLLALDLDAPPAQVGLAVGRTVTARRREVGGRALLLLTDVTDVLRREDGLRRLAAVSRGLLAGPPSVQGVLQELCTQARALTGAAYSALLLLREGSDSETSHFVYDAPRHLFPDRMPRAVGLLAVPLATREPARLDDLRGHPAGVGLPGVHPPMGPLLAAPLVAGDTVLGEVAVANPPGGRPFDAVDETLLVDLAAHAAVAVAWAQAAERERERALVRQDRLDTARHDLRTPLGAGKGFALLLQRRRGQLAPEQVDTALQGLLDAFVRIETFSRDLLVGETDAPGVVPQWTTIDVEPLVQAVRRDALAATAGAAVHWGTEQAPATVAGDPAMVRQVLDNLVGNAVRHGGGATVTARCEGDQVRFDVRDEGPGLTEQDQARLFDRWTGPGRPRTELRGLSIVKRLVVAHGGTLGVSSRPSEGATFWVTFPQVAPAGAA